MNGINNLDWNQIISRLNRNATSDLARQELANIQPLQNAQECRASFNNIICAQEIMSFGQRPFMESLDLCSTWLPRLQKRATLKTLELKDIRHFCIETMALKEILNKADTEWGHNLSAQLMNAEEPLSAIEQIMTSDGSIRTDASELLFKLYEEKKSQSNQVQKTLDKIVHKYEMEALLQDRYVTNREGRWVLPIKSGMQHNFDGIIHASSHSRQTVFMEPQEIVPINNRLREIEQEIELEIERLLKELSQYLANQYELFISSKDTLIFCDIQFSKAQLCDQLQSSTCEFTEGTLSLINLKNPVLLLHNQDVIGNTIKLDAKNKILILSGPNAGGKTVLLKSIGLAAHMARCGLPICAEKGSQLPFFKKILVAVGDAQSVDEQLSTFAAHLKHLNEATKCMGPENLLLIDEICGSTDPEEGGALAKSFIETYANHDVFGVITSHLGSLKKGWEEFSGVINGSLEFDKNTGPTYQFLMGVPGQSLAIQTALRVGVSSHIIDRAFDFLSPEHRKYQESLKEVESMKSELMALRRQLQTEQNKAEKEKSKYQALFLEIETKKEKLLEKAVEEAEKKLEQIIQEAKVKETFKKHENLQKIKVEMPTVVKASSNVEKSFKIETAEEFTRRYPPGSKVFVSQLNSDGIVQGRPNNKGEVPVLSKSMRLVLPWTELKPPEKVQNPTTEVLRKTSLFQMSSHGGDRTVDLRGLNIEDAVSKLELQLDTAALNSEDRIKVIHGHGTETLKRSIRSYLSRSPYVKKWMAGTKDSGGDGITWVELKD